VTAPDDAEIKLDGGEDTTSPVSISGSGVHMLSITSDPDSANVPVPIDVNAPAIALSPGADTTVTFQDNTKLQFSCSDIGSGLKTCAATVNGSPASNGMNLSSTIGTKTIVVNATDQAGNSSTKTVVVNVFWPFDGFFSPIVNPPRVNLVNPGSSIPIKFSLSGNRGLSIFAPGYPRSAPGCTGTPGPMTVEYPGSSSLTYNSRLDQYQFNWDTSKSYRGCRTLYMGLIDGSVHTALFNFG